MSSKFHPRIQLCLHACELGAGSHTARPKLLLQCAAVLHSISSMQPGDRAEHAAQAVISGVVYGLGDFTAQTYEQRSFGDFDFPRTLRSALCGLLAHGPLSHLYYEKLDRFFILSPVRERLR